MSRTISSDAEARSVQFPFYVMPTFEVLGASVREQSEAEVIAFCPVVETATQLPAWVDFSVAEQGWLESSVETVTSGGDSSEYQVTNITPVVYDSTVNGTGASSGSGPFLPLWQLSPPPFQPNAINLNMLSFDWFQQGFDRLTRTKEPHFTRILSPKDIGSMFSLLEVGSPDGRRSVHMVPVLEDRFDANSRMVGVIASYMSWDRYVADILPSTVNGLVFVIRNSCGQTISYEVNGRMVSPQIVGTDARWNGI
jgi:hypothetical protein